MYCTTVYESPVGVLTLAAKDDELVGLWIKKQKYFGDTVSEEMVQSDELPLFRKTKLWLDRYFDGLKPALTELPLAPQGSGFRQEVWKALCEIPYGQVATYGAIARKMATLRGIPRMASQAVGGAVGHNPISIIIPCHRVVGSNGSLVGYGSGLAAKIKLLELEGVDTSQFSIPTRGTAL